MRVLRRSILILVSLAVLFAAVPAWASSVSVTGRPAVLNMEEAGFRLEVQPKSCYHSFVAEGTMLNTKDLAPVDEFFVTRALDLKITDNNPGVLYLVKPARLVFAFDYIDFKRASDLNTGLPTGRFRIGKWDENKQNWSVLPSTVFWNGDQGIVEAEANTSGRFALLWSREWNANLSAMSGDSIRVMVDLTPILSDVSPYIREGRTMVPLRVVAENLGINVEWVAAEQRIDLYKRNSGDTVQLWIGKKGAIKNNQSLNLDVPPEITSARTFVPLRFVAEAFGADVGWDGVTRTARVLSK